MDLLTTARSPWGESVFTHISWSLFWASLVGGLLFLLAHGGYMLFSQHHKRPSEEVDRMERERGGLPSHIRTVAVIPFENLTSVSEVQQELTQALRTQLRDRLGLREAAESRASALVRGTIQRYEADIPIGFSATNKAQTSARRQLQISVDVEMIDQVTGKTVRRLDNDSPDAIGGNALHHGCKAWTRRDVVSAAHGTDTV